MASRDSDAVCGVKLISHISILAAAPLDVISKSPHTPNSLHNTTSIHNSTMLHTLIVLINSITLLTSAALLASLTLFASLGMYKLFDPVIGYVRSWNENPPFPFMKLPPGTSYLADEVLIETSWKDTDHEIELRNMVYTMALEDEDVTVPSRTLTHGVRGRKMSFPNFHGLT